MNRCNTSQFFFTSTELDIVKEFCPNGLIGFDIETTGLSAAYHEIIELGALKITPDGEMTHFQELVKPSRIIPEETYQYHFITDEMVEKKQTIDQALPAFIKFIDNGSLIAHNAQYDSGFISTSLIKNGMRLPNSEIYDSHRLTQALWPKKDKKNKLIKSSSLLNTILRPQNFRLNTLAEYFNITFNHHHALDDAYVCLKVFINLIIKLKEASPLIANNLILKSSYIANFTDYEKVIDSIKNEDKNSKLNKIYESITKSTPLEIVYQGGTFKGKRRPIQPLNILSTHQGKILYAKCLYSDLNKNFVLKRISKISHIESKTLLEDLKLNMRSFRNEDK
jgi:DNA polymerase III epsilon subunit family exonuclease